MMFYPENTAFRNLPVQADVNLDCVQYDCYLMK
ncbi:hypothetical protein FBZ85_103302 [Azospirillum brasilense]|nr:hypothetical protein FBZ84_13625 [Azospirillum baldaniorum]TWA80859.1 hypothetical protein FBZ85_103302 [Azospirillum brasilense]